MALVEWFPTILRAPAREGPRTAAAPHSSPGRHARVARAGDFHHDDLSSSRATG